jgi:hypothetical protein
MTTSDVTPLCKSLSKSVQQRDDMKINGHNFLFMHSFYALQAMNAKNFKQAIYST